jgi:hypothetical protein
VDSTPQGETKRGHSTMSRFFLSRDIFDALENDRQASPQTLEARMATTGALSQGRRRFRPGHAGFRGRQHITSLSTKAIGVENSAPATALRLSERSKTGESVCGKSSIGLAHPSAAARQYQSVSLPAEQSSRSGVDARLRRQLLSIERSSRRNIIEQLCDHTS